MRQDFHSSGSFRSDFQQATQISLTALKSQTGLLKTDFTSQPLTKNSVQDASTSLKNRLLIIGVILPSHLGQKWSAITWPKTPLKPKWPKRLERIIEPFEFLHLLLVPLLFKGKAIPGKTMDLTLAGNGGPWPVLCLVGGSTAHHPKKIEFHACPFRTMVFPRWISKLPPVAWYFCFDEHDPIPRATGWCLPPRQRRSWNWCWRKSQGHRRPTPPEVAILTSSELSFLYGEVTSVPRPAKLWTLMVQFDPNGDIYDHKIYVKEVFFTSSISITMVSMVVLCSFGTPTRPYYWHTLVRSCLLKLSPRSGDQVPRRMRADSSNGSLTAKRRRDEPRKKLMRHVNCNLLSTHPSLRII